MIKENKFVSLRYKFLEDINTQTIKNISIPNKDDYIIAYKVYLKDEIYHFDTNGEVIKDCSEVTENRAILSI